MKTTATLVCVLLFGASASLSAQDTTAVPITSPPAWVSMSDSVGHLIGITPEQQEGWKARNARWDNKYKALGTEPEKDPTYIKLHNAREFDLRGFLTGGQYDKWKVLNKRSPRLEPENPPGTNMPPDR
ncbi:MAG: hypothetical protein KF843_15075 [Flavobacteriales bacterium]|nr:hypothetical protein [Flavobacteriales bacterium]